MAGVDWPEIAYGGWDGE